MEEATAPLVPAISLCGGRWRVVRLVGAGAGATATATAAHRRPLPGPVAARLVGFAAIDDLIAIIVVGYAGPGLRERGGQERKNVDATCALPEHGDVVRVSAKVADLLLHPLQCRNDVAEGKIRAAAPVGLRSGTTLVRRVSSTLVSTHCRRLVFWKVEETPQTYAIID